jgi:hypothetical protein
LEDRYRQALVAAQEHGAGDSVGSEAVANLAQGDVEGGAGVAIQG